MLSFMLADIFNDKVRFNPMLAVGKRPVKVCTDKVRLTWLDESIKFTLKTGCRQVLPYQETSQVCMYVPLVETGSPKLYRP